MKTIYEIFIISIIAVVLFTGVASLNLYMFAKGNLDEESQNIVINYDETLGNLKAKYNESYANIYNNQTEISNLEVDTDVNTLDAFIKEYGEAKQKIGILRNGLSMVTNIPDMLFLAMPFVEEEDVKDYKKNLFYILLFIVAVSIIVALFQRRVTST